MGAIVKFAPIGGLLCLMWVLAACSESVGSGLATTQSQWVNMDEEETDAIDVSQGDSHCNWESVAILQIDSPIVPPDVPDDRSSYFVWDPEGALSGRVQGDPDARLPSDAVSVDYMTRSGVELWLDPHDADSIYLHTDESTERWPRGDAGCD